MAEDEKSLAVFVSVHFQIIISDRLPATRAEQISRILAQYGGIEHAPASKTCSSNLEGLTHIITETIDFEGYVTADDRLIAIVNQSWITSSVSKKRLANPKSHSPDPRMFFSGLVVCTAELPEGDKDAIIGGVLAMGGLYSGSISKLVTHVVALDMQPVACQTVLAKGFKCKIVRPEWFDDCLRLGKRIDETPYLHPDPPVLTEPGKVGFMARPDLQGALSPNADVEVPSSAPESIRNAIFDGKKFVLAGDLAINEHLRDAIIAVIAEAGGSVCDVVEDCDVFIGHYRHGHGYSEAYTAGREIGNLPWLYWMIGHNRWTSPLQRLLHYPIPRDGLPGTKSFRLCLSNYSGEARIYLENLAKAAGCEFTKTLKNDNTHLITAHTQSEKCDAAREWGIHLVNHLWLEESYTRCQIQSPDNPRYTHFPPHTNLTEVVGQTPIDRKALNRQFHGHDMEPSSSDPKTDAANTATTPSSSIKPLAQRKKIKQVDKRHAETPAKRMGGKENEVPVGITGGRSAKTKAAERLHDLGEDMILYEKERKRAGGVVYGGRRNSDEDRTERKRSISDADLTEENDPPGKRSKPTTEPPRLRMLVTGVPKYSGADRAGIKQRDRLRALGILITESENNCKYLVAPRIMRTRKFLCGLAQAPMLVDPSFLDDCLESNTLYDPKDYPLVDDDGETQYTFKIQESLQRAQANRGKMFRGWTIWVTAHFPNGNAPYMAIVDANGGKCLPFQGRPGSVPHAPANSDTEDEDAPLGPAYLISGPSPTEQAYWPKFRQMAQDARREPRIVQREWLLDAALKQEVRWDPKYEQRGEVEEEE